MDCRKRKWPSLVQPAAHSRSRTSDRKSWRRTTLHDAVRKSGNSHSRSNRKPGQHKGKAAADGKGCSLEFVFSDVREATAMAVYDLNNMRPDYLTREYRRKVASGESISLARLEA